jgi:MFS family permease
VGISAGISSQLMGRIGTRPLIVGGALIAAAGEYWLSRIPVHGSYLTDLLPGMMVMSFGLAPVFVAVVTAGNAGVPGERAGIAAALLNAAQQVGGALGLAVFSAVATSHTNHLLGTHDVPAHALTSGFSRALLASSIVLVAAAIVGLRTTNAHGEEGEAGPAAHAEAPMPALAGSGVK